MSRASQSEGVLGAPHGASAVAAGSLPPAPLLLGRPEFAGDLGHAAAWLNGRRVLVTGAAGSIGCPLAHALLAAGPAELVLLDHHEHSLFSLERSLSQARGGDPVYELLDVRDTKRFQGIFDRYRPEVVLHLAAAKHVPYGERFPEAVVEDNVLVIDDLLRLADRFGVDVLVYPSSDKSVSPPSLYGATKRLAEALVQRKAASGRRWLVVRYVNILWSRGSVIETFSGQIQAGLPLTVTDPRMTRYWISMDEALWLLLEGSPRSAPGEVLMPACGEPVPVIETARRLAAWYCPERAPYPIDLAGIRPGERLHEMLLSANERFDSGPWRGILRVASRRDAARLDDVPRVLEELRRLIDAGDRLGLRAAAMAAAEALQ